MVLCVLYNSTIGIDLSCCKYTLYPLNPDVKNYSIRHNLETGPVKKAVPDNIFLHFCANLWLKIQVPIITENEQLIQHLEIWHLTATK